MGGRLIVVEGLDGTGKTTLSRRFADALGATWTTTPGPELRAVREQFDAAVDGCDVARAVAYAATVIAVGCRADAERRAGRDVVVDRYWLSTLVHAAPAAWDALAALEPHVPAADITLYVSAPLELRGERMRQRGLTAADAATLQPAASLWLDRRFRSRGDLSVVGSWLELDGSGTPDAILDAAIRAIESVHPAQCAMWA